MKDIDKVVRKFRDEGLKITPQRLSIFEILHNNHSHPSAEDIYREVLKIHPSISFTTVYKTLQTLRDMGEIQELTVDPERTHYDPDTRHHIHTFCSSCGKIGDLPYPQETPLPLQLPREQSGFEIRNIQIHALGVCGTCR